MPAFAQSQRERWNAPTPPFRILDQVNYVGTAGLGAYLFTSSEGHILLDGALPESVPQIEASIEALGFRLSDVKILLNSHAHFDHSGGLAQLKADTGAQVIAHAADRSALEGGFYAGSEMVKALGAPPVKVDRAIRDGDVVSLGELKLTARHTPGHSPGCTSWEMTGTDKGERLKVLVFCSASVAANRITPPLQYPGIVEDYRKTFRIAETLTVDVFLAPHPEFFDMAARRAELERNPSSQPFVDRAAFPAFIARQKAEFERELANRSALAKEN
jgi:metallo-beta-lactamase class B